MQTMETTSDIVQLVDEFRMAIREHRLDEAQALLDGLGVSGCEVGSRPIYPTMLAIANGDAVGALQRLRALDEAPEELIAICLREAGDPTWEGLATSLAVDSPDPQVREAMLALLGQSTGTEEPKNL